MLRLPSPMCILPYQLACMSATRAAASRRGLTTRRHGARAPLAWQCPGSGLAPTQRPHKCPGALLSAMRPCTAAMSSLAKHGAHLGCVRGHADMFGESAFR